MSVRPFRKVHDDALKAFDTDLEPWELPHYRRIDTGPAKGCVISFPGCSGACDQGRKTCVTPQACERSENETPLGWWARIKRWFHELVADVESWK